MEAFVQLQTNQNNSVKAKVTEILNNGDSKTEESDRGFSLQKCLKTNHWGVTSLRKLKNLLKDSDFRLHELLEGSTILLPEPEKPEPRNPELEDRIRRLKIKQENKEYEKMTENVDCGQRTNIPETAGQDTFGQDLRGMNRQLTMVVNTVLTVGSCFYFIYKGVGFMMPEQRDGPVPILSAVLASFVVLLADLYFIAKSLD